MSCFFHDKGWRVQSTDIVTLLQKQHNITHCVNYRHTDYCDRVCLVQQHGCVITCPVMYGLEILIHFPNLTVQPLKLGMDNLFHFTFSNGRNYSSMILQLNYVGKRGPVLMNSGMINVLSSSWYTQTWSLFFVLQRNSNENFDLWYTWYVGLFLSWVFQPFDIEQRQTEWHYSVPCDWCPRLSKLLHICG